MRKEFRVLCRRYREEEVRKEERRNKEREKERRTSSKKDMREINKCKGRERERKTKLVLLKTLYVMAILQRPNNQQTVKYELENL